MPDKYILIVAGGKGERMASTTPKQFLLLAGKPVLMHTISLFHAYDPHISIILVLPEFHQDTWTQLCREHQFTIPHRVVSGGETRFHSVRNGLALVPQQALVGVHDGVRPLVSREVVSRCFDEAWKHAAAIPVLPVVESVREVEGESSKPVDRDKFRIVQTPQVFRSEVLLKAYSVAYQASFTDDASVVEPFVPIHLVAGNRENIKITTPEDLIIAEAFLRSATGELA